MRPKVLIVDDSVDFSELLKTRLGDLGAAVCGEARNSEEGLRLFRSLEPDLVTLDLVMPDDSGFTALDLCGVIRSESPQTAVLILGTQPTWAHSGALMGLAALGYLDKSFGNFDEVKRILLRTFPDMEHSAAGVRSAGGNTGRVNEGGAARVLSGATIVSR